jgi:uncharacterized HAD superfamily protein
LQKICALDIDGVLNYYPDCWVDFVNLRTGTEQKFDDINQVKKRLSYLAYKRLKHEYRESAFKASVLANEEAIEFTHILRRAGYFVVIVTARPFDDYPGLMMRTLGWLTANNFHFDDLFNSRKKHIDIMLRHPYLDFMVEDNRAIANSIAGFGRRVFLMSNRYNSGKIAMGVERVESFADILAELKL